MDFKSRLDPEAKLGLRLTLIFVAFVLVAIPFAFLLLEVLVEGPVTARDQRVANDLNKYNLREDDGVSVAMVITRLGSTLVLAVIVLAVAAYLAVFHKRRRQALFLVTTVVLGIAVNNLLKLLVGRARPTFDEGGMTAFGHSFPSGHAMNSTVVYLSLLVLVWPRLRTLGARLMATAGTVALVAAIAASRVVLTVHYVSDVIAGVILGMAFVFASAAAFAAWRHEGGRLPPAVENAPAVGEPTVTTDTTGSKSSSDVRATLGA